MEDKWLPMPRYKLRKDLVKKILRGESTQGKSCLELGYGAGDMLLLFAMLGMNVYGFDFSEQALQLARLRIDNHPALKHNITLLEKETDINRKKYDYIMAFEVLEHIEDDASRLRKWCNLLNDKGRILLSVPAHQSKWGANDVACGHFRRYERHAMNALLVESGFQVLEFWNYAYPISMILDICLHKKTLPKQDNDLSMKQRSMQSGIKRQNSMVNKLLSSDLILTPFFLLQRCFLNRDLSSAYLVLARKNSDLWRA